MAKRTPSSKDAIPGVNLLILKPRDSRVPPGEPESVIHVLPGDAGVWIEDRADPMGSAMRAITVLMQGDTHRRAVAKANAQRARDGRRPSARATVREDAEHLFARGRTKKQIILTIARKRNLGFHTVRKYLIGWHSKKK
jgi:hypothetical protein